ncbi:MAG TPA: hypothetical protein VGN05_05325 [Parvibaculum sp.]|jgi:hypothetical protein
MMRAEMTLKRLAEIVEAYGASARRWPAAERQAAEELAARDPQARALIEEASHLDSILDLSPESTASEALISRIMAARPRTVPVSVAMTVSGLNVGLWRSLVQAVWPYGSPAFPAGALALSVMLGVSLGLASPSAVGALGLTSTTTTTATTNAAGEQLVAFALGENEYPEDWKK